MVGTRRSGVGCQLFNGVGRACEYGVMHQERHAVGAELGIAFKHPVAVLRAQAERGKCVFRCQLAGTPVGNPERVRPLGGVSRHWI